MASANVNPVEIEVARVGTFTATGGQTTTFTGPDLAAIALGYSPDAHEAPVVIGHPKSDAAPAYGWVAGLRMDGDRLKAMLDKVPADFAELVKAGHYRHVSPSFYLPGNPSNPTPGTLYLRHVAFLGAQPPAIKGLKAVEFSDGADAQTLTLEFGEEDPAAELARLRAENERLRAAQSADFSEQIAKARRRLDNEALLNGLVAHGKPLPMGKVEILDFMDRLDASEVIEFSEGAASQPMNALEFFKGLLSNLPKQVEFAEVAGGGGEEEGPEDQARRLGEYVEQQRAKGRTINFSDALFEMTSK